MGEPSISEIVPGLFIGNLWASSNVDFLRQNHIRSILSVNDCNHIKWAQPCFTELFPVERHLRIFCHDSSNQDLLIHMRRVCDFIDESLSHGRVLVHCVLGISRSATFVIAYLMRQQHSPLVAILADVRQKRPRVKPSANFLAQLEV